MLSAYDAVACRFESAQSLLVLLLFYLIAVCSTCLCTHNIPIVGQPVRHVLLVFVVVSDVETLLLLK